MLNPTHNSVKLSSGSKAVLEIGAIFVYLRKKLVHQTSVIPSFGRDRHATCSGPVPVVRVTFLSSFIVFPSDDGVKETNDGRDCVERFLGVYVLKPG